MRMRRLSALAACLILCSSSWEFTLTLRRLNSVYFIITNPKFNCVKPAERFQKLPRVPTFSDILGGCLCLSAPGRLPGALENGAVSPCLEFSPAGLGDFKSTKQKNHNQMLEHERRDC